MDNSWVKLCYIALVFEASVGTPVSPLKDCMCVNNQTKQFLASLDQLY